MNMQLFEASRWHILRNPEDRLSVWPEGLALPAGWAPALPGFAASRDDCLARIETLWQDPRPAALRAVMA